MKNRDVDLFRRYGTAVLAVTAATLARLPLNSFLGERVPFVTFFIAVVIVAHHGGLWPSVVATLLSALAAAIFFIPPQGLAIEGAAGWVGLATFLFVGFGIAYLSDLMRSARVRAQDRQDELRTILASIGDAVIATDEHGKVVFLNGVAEALTGWDENNALGQPLETIFRIVNEHTRKPVENPAIRALREGVIVGLANHTLLIAKDGSERPIDDSAAPINSEHGATHGCVLIFRDVSERRCAERDLQRSERELSDFFENATVGLHWVGPDGTILRANRTELRMLGYEREEYIGHNIAEFHADADVIEDILQQLTDGNALHDRAARLRCKDGSIKHVLISSNVLWEDGQFVHSRCFTRDVTEQKIAEEALRASEEQARRHLAELQTVYASAPIGLAFVNCDFRYVNINDALAEINGIPRQEIIGRTLREVLPDDIIDRVEPLYRQVLETGEPVNAIEVRGRIPSDSDASHDYLVNYHPVRSSDGMLLGINAAVQDITERKRAEEALRESEQRFRLLADTSPVLIWLSDSERKGSYFSRPWLDFTGRTHEQELGDGWLESVHPDDYERVVGTCSEAVRRKEPFRFEFRLRRFDGEYRWILDHGVPLFTEQGKLTGYIGSCVDVHDRKRGEENTRFLSEATSTLAELIDYESTLVKVGAVAVPTFADWSVVDVLNDDGVLKRITVNHSDASKRKLADELAERYPSSIDSPRGAGQVARTGEAELVEEIPESLLEEAAQDQEHLRVLRSLGLKSYICVPMKIRGRTLGVLTFVMAESERRFDATDLIIAQELADRAAIAVENATFYRELQEADRRKNEFLAILAHELRNPLAPIRSGLELMRIAHDDEAMIGEARETMERQTQQLITLVDDLLDVSRITRGKLEIRKSRVLLQDVVKSGLEASQPFIDEGRHQLTVSLPDEAVYLEADPNRLAQVLSNLLNNAAKYTPEGGHIELSAEHDQRDVAISVKDTGVGIPIDQREHIFDMFAQVQHPVENSYTGLGIGLTLVKSLVELHNGSVDVRSDGINRGSTFLVRLPVASEPKNADSSQHSPRDIPKVAKQKVLIVDDNKAAAHMLSLVVKTLGHEVRTANDGPQALEIAAEFIPDVVFLDLGMPRMSGYEVATRIRNETWGQEMTLVALTGWGQAEHRQKSKEAGFDHHLVKPAAPADLDAVFSTLGT